MSNARDNLIQRAEAAIDDVFYDMSVSQPTTAHDLRELRELIDTLLQLLPGG